MTRCERSIDLVVTMIDGLLTSVRMASSWTYDSSSPLQVIVAFGDGDEPRSWTFARSIVGDGLIDEAGDGDIRIRPFPGGLFEVTLANNYGTCTMHGALARLDGFYRATVRLVPPGTERVDVDAAIARILKESIDG